MAGFCGIDFGTSNSALAAGTADGVRLIDLEPGQVTIPTAIFFNQDTHHTAFGRAAVTQYLDGYDGRFMRALKTILGSSLMEDTTQVGRERKDFAGIIGLFIGHIKRVAEGTLRTELSQVVVGRPVRFVDHDDAADARAENELRAIVQAQGFKDIAFEFEPLAAARDYESRLAHEELVLVADIGGGTSDFSVIRVSPERRGAADRSGDILANAGIHIGGTDFDKRFSLSAIMPALGYRTLLKNGLDVPSNYYHTLSTWHLINTLYTRKMHEELKSLPRDAEEPDLIQRLAKIVAHQRGHELASVVEAAKIALSERPRTAIDATFVADDMLFDVDAADLAAAVHGDIRAVIATALDTVTKRAGLRPQAIDTIFLTGGSTALPGFEDAMRAAFPDARLNYGDRFSSVAAGLGLKARQMFG